MSKESAFYQVIENRLRLQRAREQAERETGILENQLNTLAKRMAALCAGSGLAAAPVERRPPARPSRNADWDVWNQHVSSLRRLREALEDQLSKMEAAAETGEILARLAGRRALGSGDHPARNGLSVPTHGRASEVKRALGRLHPRVARGKRQELNAFAVSILRDTRGARGETLLIELALRVEQANRAVEKRLRDADKAAMWRDRLRGLDGSDVDECLEELKAIESGRREWTAELERRVEQSERAARARADREYALSVIAEELERLGYRVEPPTCEGIGQRGRTLLRPPTMAAYRVVFEHDASNCRIDVKLARIGEPTRAVSEQQKLRDIQAERSWCEDYATARRAASRRGVRMRSLRRVPAGATVLEILEHSEASVTTREAEQRGTGYSVRCSDRESEAGHLLLKGAAKR